jgi:hypothetical protein
LDRQLKPSQLSRLLSLLHRGYALVLNNRAYALPFVLVFASYGQFPKLFESDWVKGNTWHQRTEREYLITLVENPLSFILTQPNVLVKPSEKTAIEAVYDLQVLKDNYCPQNICAFFKNKTKPDYTVPQARAMAFAAIKIFRRYPLLFLESRWRTLESVGEDNPITICNRDYMSEKGYGQPAEWAVLQPLARRIEAAVSLTEGADGLLGGKQIWWNVPFWAIVLTAIAAFGYKRRYRAESQVACLLLLRSLAVFIATPAGFTSYYLTLFIGAPVLVILLAAERFKSRRTGYTADISRRTGDTAKKSPA